MREYIETVVWKAVAPLRREGGELLVVERNRFTGEYRVTINERMESCEVRRDG